MEYMDLEPTIVTVDHIAAVHTRAAARIALRGAARRDD